MYTTKAEDLTRIANDLDQLARKYGDGAQQLDQQTAGLDGATQQLILGGPEHWLGVSSEAFQAAWDERRARLQQISQILSQSAQHFTQFARTIEDNLPTIRADQAVMQELASHRLGVDDQASLLNEESQAQNAVITALSLLNSQLEQMAEEVKDCPQEQERNLYPGYGDINKSDSSATDHGDQGDGVVADGTTTQFFQLYSENDGMGSGVSPLGEKYLQEIKDKGVTVVDSSDSDTRGYMRSKNARGDTWFTGIPGVDAGPDTTTVLLGPNVNDAALYEEYLHVENGEARGWIGLSEEDGWAEEIQVETQVLSKADELRMTTTERKELQGSIENYRDMLFNKYRKIVP